MPSESRVYGHDQDEIDHIQYRQNGSNRRGGNKSDTGFAPAVPDHLQRPVQMHRCFSMHCDIIAAALCKMRNIPFRFPYHEMGIKYQCRVRTQVLDEFWSERDIGYKHTIHDIKMNPLCTACIDTFHFLCGTGKISGKHARCNNQRCFFHTPVITGSRRFCNVNSQEYTTYLLICFGAF